MAVFLTVLKIIGIVLASLLGVVLLLLFIILFAPIGYESDGLYDDENRPLINARVHWLLHIIRFRFTLNGKEQEKELKVLFFRLYPKKEKEEKVKEVKKEKEEDEDEEIVKVSGGDAEDTEEAFERLEDKLSAEADEPPLDEEEPEESVYDETRKEDTPKERIPLTERIKSTLDKIKYKFNDICDKIRDGRMKAEDMVEKLSDERTKNAVIELWEVLKKLLWHIRPRYFSLYLHYGMEDPSLTGQIYGIYNSFYPIHKGKPVIVPDFDEKCLDGNYRIKGHIQLFFVLTALVRLYFNKDVKRLYAMIKK